MEPYHSQPHGEHQIVLVEDQLRPGQRIYEVRDTNGGRLGFTGEEIASLAAWWATEACRKGTDEALP